MFKEKEKCVFCDGYEPEFDTFNDTLRFRCPTCGDYSITKEANHDYKNLPDVRKKKVVEYIKNHALRSGKILNLTVKKVDEILLELEE